MSLAFLQLHLYHGCENMNLISLTKNYLYILFKIIIIKINNFIIYIIVYD